MLQLVISNILLVLALSTSGEGQNTPESAPPCGGYYDCDFYFDYHTAISSLADCKRKCVRSCRCEHYSYNYNQSSPYYRHCYLSYHCTDPLPAIGNWISGPKVCKKHIVGGDRTYYYSPYADRLNRTQRN